MLNGEGGDEGGLGRGGFGWVGFRVIHYIRGGDAASYVRGLRRQVYATWCCKHPPAAGRLDSSDEVQQLHTPDTTQRAAAAHPPSRSLSQTRRNRPSRLPQVLFSRLQGSLEVQKQAPPAQITQVSQWVHLYEL